MRWVTQGVGKIIILRIMGMKGNNMKRPIFFEPTIQRNDHQTYKLNPVYYLAYSLEAESEEELLEKEKSINNFFATKKITLQKGDQLYLNLGNCAYSSMEKNMLYLCCTPIEPLNETGFIVWYSGENEATVDGSMSLNDENKILQYQWNTGLIFTIQEFYIFKNSVLESIKDNKVPIIHPKNTVEDFTLL